MEYLGANREDRHDWRKERRSGDEMQIAAARAEKIAALTILNSAVTGRD